MRSEIPEAALAGVSVRRRTKLSGAGGTSRQTMLGAILFVLGFAAVFTSYGAAFGGPGTALQSHQQALTRVLGGFTIFRVCFLPGRW